MGICNGRASSSCGYGMGGDGADAHSFKSSMSDLSGAIRALPPSDQDALAEEMSIQVFNGPVSDVALKLENLVEGALCGAPSTFDAASMAPSCGELPFGVDQGKLVAALRDLASAIESKDAHPISVHTGQRTTLDDFSQRSLLIRYVSKNPKD